MSKNNPVFFANALEKIFPHVGSFLEAETDFQFLCAILLSAQMTDVGVNKVTRKLFEHMKTPQDALHLGEEKIYSFVKSVNYGPTKARHIFATATLLVENFGGEIPKTRKELVLLPGVGNKTAGVFLLQKGYDFAFPVDTHIFRIATAFGFTNKKKPDEVEKDLQKIFPKEIWNDLHLRMILYGRNFLSARNVPQTVTLAWKELEKNLQNAS